MMHSMRTQIVSKTVAAMLSLSLIMSIGFGTIANAVASPTTSGSATAAAVPADLTTLISRGDSEITRRLAKLQKANDMITSDTKLKASDKSALLQELNSETSGLTALLTGLNSATTVAAARSDDQSIILNYRAYALVVPQAIMIRYSDDEQVTQASLNAIASKIVVALNTATAETAAPLRTKLSQMESTISAANEYSVGVENAIIGLTPSSYDADHSVLSGYLSDLATAHGYDVTARQDGLLIAESLPS